MANDHSSFKTSKIRVSACPGKNRKKMHKRICFHITIKSPIQDFFSFFLGKAYCCKLVQGLEMTLRNLKKSCMKYFKASTF